MSPNPIVVMLYVELGMFLAGLTCLIVARMVEPGDTQARATSDASRGEKRRTVLSRLGT